MRRRVAITGAGGQLGRQLVRAFRDAGDEVLALARREFDITRPADLARLTKWQPDLVVNCAAWTDVDGCARDPDRAMQINGEAAGAVAEAAARAGALIVQISTNEVFDGTLERPYREGDEPNPINPYGLSKLVGERLVVRANRRHLIVRTAWLYGGGKRGFPEKIRRAAREVSRSGSALRVVSDEFGNPTDVTWLAGAIRALLEHHGSVVGVYHLAGQPPTSRFAWAQRLLEGTDTKITPIPLKGFRRDSRVPPRAVLDTSKAEEMGIAPGTWH